MPLFFLMSGLFASRSLTASWARFAREKLVRYAYLYALWSSLWLVALGARAAAGGRPVGEALLQPAIGVVTAADRLWYLVALPVFFAAARTARRVPIAAQLAVAGLLSAAVALDLVTMPSWGLDRMPQYLVWFLAGCYAGPLIRGWAARRTAAGTAGLAAAWVAAATLLSGTPRAAELFLPLVAVPCLVATTALARGWAATIPAWLGRRTLPVYVLHSLSLAILTPAALVLPQAWAVAGVYLLAVAATALSVGIWLLLRRWRFLFDLPRGARAGRDAGDETARRGW